MTQGAHAGALSQPSGVGRGERWEGGSGDRRHGYTDGPLIFMYGRGQHNIVNQLSFN